MENLETILANTQVKIEELNAASQQNVLRESAVISAKEDVKNLNAIWQSEQFAALKNAEDPLSEAISQLTYQQYKLTDKTDRDSGIREFSLDIFSKRINLLNFVSFCSPATIVADPKITCKLANFAMLLSARKAIDLGVSKEEIDTLLSSYRLIKKAERVQVGDRKKILTSNSTMKDELQTLVNGFIPGLKPVKDEDVNFMIDIFTSQGKENLSVRLGDPKKMADIMIQVLNHLKTGKKYSVEYKKTSK